MNTIRPTLIVTLALTAACGGAYEETAVEIPTWAEFKLEARRAHEGETFYVVDGDIPVTLDQLRELYERTLERAQMEAAGLEIAQDNNPLLVHQYGGADDVWTAAQAAHLTYCVTTDFGPVNHARMVAEMAQATAAWERVAGVDFIYVPAHDSDCKNTNPGVVFSVRPTTLNGACAFFPNDPATYGCVAKTLIININAIDTNPGFGGTTTLGVLKHELGHILGFRHEHARVPNSSCSEPDTRSVTAYDSASVMHYPWCPGGTQTGDLVITDLDAIGADTIYPRHPGCNDDAYVMDGPYAQQTNGATFRKTSTYREYPVYSKGAWSIYRRANGLWYLDLGQAAHPGSVGTTLR